MIALARQGAFVERRMASRVAPFLCHPGEGRDLDFAVECSGEIPGFAGMTDLV
jgi:hypothetical protein